MKIHRCEEFPGEKTFIVRHEHKQYRVVHLPPDRWDVYGTRSGWNSDIKQNARYSYTVTGQLEADLIAFVKEKLNAGEAA